MGTCGSGGIWVLHCFPLRKYLNNGSRWALRKCLKQARALYLKFIVHKWFLLLLKFQHMNHLHIIEMRKNIKILFYKMDFLECVPKQLASL